MDELTVQRFWQGHACGDSQVGGLHLQFQGDYEKFFTDYDLFRYQTERHLPACIEALNVAGKQVLEIGLGAGSEAELLLPQSGRSRMLGCGGRMQGRECGQHIWPTIKRWDFSAICGLKTLSTTPPMVRITHTHWCTTASGSSIAFRHLPPLELTSASCTHRRCQYTVCLADR